MLLYLISPKRIYRESLKTFLEERLRKLTIEKLHLTRKYGVKNLDEMERFYLEEKLSEKDSWEDYFELSHIDSEIESINKALKKLGCLNTAH